MHGVRLIVSDDHADMRAAREAVFPGVPWQRCQFHLAQNAMGYVPRASMRREVAEDIRTIFNAADVEEAERRLTLTIRKYEDSAPKLATWLDDSLREGFTAFTLPAPHRRRLRTTNGLERVHKEIKRRTRVATLFPNEAAVERLVAAMLAEIDEEWTTGRQYLNMELV